MLVGIYLYIPSTLQQPITDEIHVKRYITLERTLEESLLNTGRSTTSQAVDCDQVIGFLCAEVTEQIKGKDSSSNNLSKHFILSNNNTICHRINTEGFKTGLAQVFFYVFFFFF